MKLSVIKEQVQEAQDSDKDAMSSSLIVEGEIMSFEIEELKIRLKEREIEVLRRSVLTAHTNLLHPRGMLFLQQYLSKLTRRGI